MTSKTPEQLEAEALALTGKPPTPIDELGTKLLDSFFEHAYERMYYQAIQDLIAEGADCDDDSAYRLASERWLAQIRERYQLGDDLALFDALDHCAKNSLVMPEWVANELTAKYRKVTSFEAKTLDESFWPSRPKNTKAQSMQRRRNWATVIYFLTVNENEIGAPIDEGLFERLGEELGLTMSTTRRYFYWFKNSNDPVIAAARSTIDRMAAIANPSLVQGFVKSTVFPNMRRERVRARRMKYE